MREPSLVFFVFFVFFRGQFMDLRLSRNDAVELRSAPSSPGAAGKPNSVAEVLRGVGAASTFALSATTSGTRLT